MKQFICWLLTGHGRAYRFGPRVGLEVKKVDDAYYAVCPYCGHRVHDLGVAGELQVWKL